MKVRISTFFRDDAAARRRHRHLDHMFIDGRQTRPRPVRAGAHEAADLLRRDRGQVLERQIVGLQRLEDLFNPATGFDRNLLSLDVHM